MTLHRGFMTQFSTAFRDGNRSKRSEQKGLLGSVRCFKVKARFGSMLDVLNRAPARFDQAWTELLDSTRYSLAAVTRKMVCPDLRPCYKSICNAKSHQFPYK